SRPLPRGTAASCRIGENVVVAGHGGRPKALRATVFAKREFAGYWEYVLDEAIYTAPLRMRGRGVDRFIEHVFPVPGELPLGEHRGAQRLRPPAVARDHHVLADAARSRGAARERLDADLAERLHQAEAGGLVVGERKS